MTAFLLILVRKKNAKNKGNSSSSYHHWGLKILVDSECKMITKKEQEHITRRQEIIITQKVDVQERRKLTLNRNGIYIEMASPYTLVKGLWIATWLF